MARREQLRARLFVAGAHLSKAHGLTVREIREEEWPIALEVQTVTEDTPHGVAVSMGAALMGFGSGWNAHRPDAILALGDRFETFCAVAAAAPFRIPVFHLHGGEATEGLYDEAFRHAITKMSHVHLVANEWAGGRIRALGEEAWRVRVVGAVDGEVARIDQHHAILPAHLAQAGQQVAQAVEGTAVQRVASRMGAQAQVVVSRSEVRR